MKNGARREHALTKEEAKTSDRFLTKCTREAAKPAQKSACAAVRKSIGLPPNRRSY